MLKFKEKSKSVYFFKTIHIDENGEASGEINFKKVIKKIFGRHVDYQDAIISFVHRTTTGYDKPTVICNECPIVIRPDPLIADKIGYYEIGMNFYQEGILTIEHHAGYFDINIKKLRFCFKIEVPDGGEIVDE